MNRLGIIDIGSNSIRLVVLEIYNESAYKIIYEIKESVRLAKDMSADGNLNENRIDLAIETLKLFKDICDGYQAMHIISVATAAVRTALNQKIFIARVKQEVGLSIRVLSGLEEAYYDYFGTINSINIRDCLIMDIGGASIELILVENKEAKESICLPFGAITLSEKFNLLENTDKFKLDSINEFLTKNFENISWLEEAMRLPLIGIGGTMRNVGKIHRRKFDFPLEITHNYTFKTKDFLDIYSSVKEMDLKQRKKIKGLSKDRADIFIGAASAIKCLITYCSCPTLSISGSGVREGLIYEFILKGKTPLADVLDHSLNSLMLSHGFSYDENLRIWELAYRLFEQLQPIHKLNSGVLNILKTSALLYNIGINVNSYSSNNHSFYIILYSKINGLTPKEKLIAANVLKILKKDGIQDSIIEDMNILVEKDLITIRTLASIIRISISLNLRRNNNVRDVFLLITENDVTIDIKSEKNPIAEFKALISIAEDFERIFNKRLKVKI